jgi:large subunit ribosomal protein L32
MAEAKRIENGVRRLYKMGVPKRRHSKSRSNKRAAEWRKIDKPGLVECPQCKELKLPHHACLNCGYYKGKSVM